MISKWDDFKKINESINPYAMKMCGYYRVNENQLNLIIDTLNKIDNFALALQTGYNYDQDKNYLVIETFDIQKIYDIISKSGVEKLPFDRDYDHDCVLLKSKPVTCPPGAYM